MKIYFKLIIISAFLIFIQVAGAVGFVDSITYHDTELIKKFDNHVIAEYIPQEETLDSWTKLFAIRVLQNSPSSEESIKRFKDRLTPGDSEQPLSPKFITSHSSTEKNVHFIAFFANDNNFFEYNVFRYIDIGPGKVISFQIAKRLYIEGEEDADEALEWIYNQINNSKQDIIFLFDDKLAERVFGA